MALMMDLGMMAFLLMEEMCGSLLQKQMMKSRITGDSNLVLLSILEAMSFRAAGHGRVAMNCHTCAIDSIAFLPMLLLFLLTGISIILTPTKDLLLHPWKLCFKVGPWELLGSVDNTISQQMEGFKQGQESLWNHVFICIGQHVKVTFHVRDLPGSPFLLSSEVIKVHHVPTPMHGIHPMQDCKDHGNEKGSMDLSEMIVPWVPCPTCHGNSQL
jgi:hypothetical protein